MPKAMPQGYHTVTPSLTVKDSKKAIAFYKKAFGAKVITVFPMLDGKGTMHAVMQIGNSLIMMGDEMSKCKSAETMGGSPMSLYIYVPDADKTFKKAIAAGATVVMPMMDMFWGDRAGNVLDPFGYSWTIATNKKKLTRAQIQKGAKAFFAQMAEASV